MPLDKSKSKNELCRVHIVLPSSTDSSPEDHWIAGPIYRWPGHVIQAWKGPSAEGNNAEPACQLKEGTAETGYIDLGRKKPHIARKTGTVLGELISFEQSDPGFFPSHRSIEIRLAIKQTLLLTWSLTGTKLVREDGTLLAKFSRRALKISSLATHSEGTTAVLIYECGILSYMKSTIDLWSAGLKD